MFSIVIKITKFNECPKRAIKSVINNLTYVKDVHIINPYFTNEEECMYKGWKEDKNQIKNVHFSPSLIEKNLEGIIVEIPPNCDVKAGAFNTIDKQMRHANEEQNTLALIPVLKLDGYSIFHGYFIILYLIDWFWNRLFENNKLIQYTDIRAKFIIRKGTKAFLPKSSFFHRFWNPQTIGKIFADTAEIKESKITQTLYNHEHFKFGLWIIPYGILWFITTTAFVAMPGSVYSICLWILGSLLSWLTTFHYVKSSYSIFYISAFPIYWVTFPFLIFYSRIK